MKKILYSFIAFLLVFTLLPMQGMAKTQEEHDIALWNAVNPLNTTVTFLNTGAHPDDERSDLLAFLSRGKGVKTSSLIANRGEGGQNEIGNELGNALGIIRSNEMIEAADVTGVKAYHLSEETSDSIYDFGFSKSPEETLEKWGEDVTYERLIRFLRTYQPDIVMPSFRNVDSQHGHHRAMAVLSERAYKDAADPSVYPKQLEEEGLSVWQIKKLYLPAETEEQTTLSIEIGDLDPIYGQSYPQIGEDSRYLHKSQGMGNDVEVEPRQFKLQLIDSVNDQKDEDIFTGIPFDFTEWAEKVENTAIKSELTALQNSLDEIVEAYPDRNAIYPLAHDVLKDVNKVAEDIKASDLDDALKNDLTHKLELKQEQLNEVSNIASNLNVETTVDSHVLTKGEETDVTVTVKNDGTETRSNIDLALLAPDTWTIDGKQTIDSLAAGESKDLTFHVKVAEDAEIYRPYDEPALQTSITTTENGETASSILKTDDTVAVLPDISLDVSPSNVVVNTADIKDGYKVEVEAKSYAKNEQNAKVSLELPEGWTSEPAAENVTLAKRGDTAKVAFTLIPPKDPGEEALEIGVKAEANGKAYDAAVQEIKYEHINDAYYLYPAVINVSSFELNYDKDLKIGYIDSGFEEVADSLLNLGFNVTNLTEEDLASGDLDQYDTIVTGIRANLSRPDLIENNDRLKEYAKNGGNVVFQYHKPFDNWDADNTMPYKLELGLPSIEWRVTDENAKVTMTQPDHELFNKPNKITDHDWDNWVQERGLYFPMEWDDKYETFVSMADPDEEAFDGGILLADYGKGSYIYTNLVFYRQINNQVPGGYRIFTNLLSYDGGGEDAEEWKGYKDVPESNDHYDAIKSLTQQNILTGYENNMFKPWNNLSREHAAVIFNRITDYDTPEDIAKTLEKYTDVKSDYEYAEEIAKVTEAGVFNGDHGKFMPRSNITREQMATVLVRALELKKYDTGEDVKVNLKNVDESHQKNVQILANLGLTTQLDNYRPAEEISRAAFASLVERSMNIEKE